MLKIHRKDFAVFTTTVLYLIITGDPVDVQNKTTIMLKSRRKCQWRASTEHPLQPNDH